MNGRPTFAAKGLSLKTPTVVGVFFCLWQPHRGIRNHVNRRRRLGASPIFLDVGHEWPTYVCFGFNGGPRPTLQTDCNNHRVRLGAPLRLCHPRRGLALHRRENGQPHPVFPRRGRRTLTLTVGQGPPYRRITTTIGCASAHRFGLAIRGKIALHRRENGRPYPAFPRRGRRTLALMVGQGPPYRRIATTIGCAPAHRSQYLLRVIIFVDYR